MEPGECEWSVERSGLPAQPRAQHVPGRDRFGSMLNHNIVASLLLALSCVVCSQINSPRRGVSPFSCRKQKGDPAAPLSCEMSGVNQVIETVGISPPNSLMRWCLWEYMPYPFVTSQINFTIRWVSRCGQPQGSAACIHASRLENREPSAFSHIPLLAGLAC